MSTLKTNEIQTTSGKKILGSTGSVIQTVHAPYTTVTTGTSSGNRVDISGFNASITPSSTSSKVLIICHMSGVFICDGRIDLKRNGTVCKQNLLGTDRDANDDVNTHCGLFLDSPNTTSAITYQCSTVITGCSTTYHVNRSQTGSTGNGVSGLTLMEISA